jgi:hypothetical protein
MWCCKELGMIRGGVGWFACWRAALAHVKALQAQGESADAGFAGGQRLTLWSPSHRQRFRPKQSHDHVLPEAAHVI